MNKLFIASISLFASGSVRAAPFEAQIIAPFDVQRFVENASIPVLAVAMITYIAYLALRGAGKNAEKQTDLTRDLIRDNAARELRRDNEVFTDKSVAAEREKRQSDLLKAQQDVTIHTLPALARAIKEATAVSRDVAEQRKKEIAASAAQTETAREHARLMTEAVREIKGVADQLRLWRREDLDARRAEHRAVTGPLSPSEGAAATTDVQVEGD